MRNSLKKHQQKCTDYSWKTLAIQAKVSVTNLWGSTTGAQPSANSQAVDLEQEASQQKSVTVACFMSLEIKGEVNGGAASNEAVIKRCQVSSLS